MTLLDRECPRLHCLRKGTRYRPKMTPQGSTTQQRGEHGLATAPRWARIPS